MILLSPNFWTNQPTPTRWQKRALPHTHNKRGTTVLEPVQATRGCPGERRRIYLEQARKRHTRVSVMTFLRSLLALFLALNTAAAQQGSSSQPSFFLQDPSDGESGCVPSTCGPFPPPPPCVRARPVSSLWRHTETTFFNKHVSFSPAEFKRREACLRAC